MDLFTAVAQLIPLYVGASVFLAGASKAPWVRALVIVAGVGAALAEALAVLGLAGAGSGRGMGKPLLVGVVLLTVCVGGVGMFAGAIPNKTLTLWPFRRRARQRADRAPTPPGSPSLPSARPQGTRSEVNYELMLRGEELQSLRDTIGRVRGGPGSLEEASAAGSSGLHDQRSRRSARRQGAVI